MPDDKQWDLMSLLKTSAAFFAEKGIDEARLTAELLLAHILKMKRMELYLAFDRPISQRELTEYRELCRRRLTGEPVQYIIGEEEFFGFKFLVDRRVLIPRPETELLVEAILDDLKVKSLSGAKAQAALTGTLEVEPETQAALAEASSVAIGTQTAPPETQAAPVELPAASPPESRVLDIGTGSGCIAITLAKKLLYAKLSAVDISRDALDVALANAGRHSVSERIVFIQADALDARFAENFPEKFDIIVSNPPYIPQAEAATLQAEVVHYEPHTALFAPTGFEFYEKITSDSAALLASGGRLYFELHADAAPRVEDLLRSEGFSNIVLRKDFGGIVRIASAIKK